MLLFSSIDARLWFSSEVQNTYQASEPQIIGSYTGTLIEEQIHVSLTFWQNKEQLSLTLYIVVTDVFILFLFYSVVNLLLLPSPPPLPSQSPPQYVHHRMYLEPENPQKTREICLCFCCFFFTCTITYTNGQTLIRQKRKKNRCVSDSPTDPSLNPPTLTFFFCNSKK